MDRVLYSGVTTWAVAIHHPGYKLWRDHSGGSEGRRGQARGGHTEGWAWSECGQPGCHQVQARPHLSGHTPQAREMRERETRLGFILYNQTVCKLFRWKVKDCKKGIRDCQQTSWSPPTPVRTMLSSYWLLGHNRGFWLAERGQE